MTTCCVFALSCRHVGSSTDLLPLLQINAEDARDTTAAPNTSIAAGTSSSGSVTLMAALTRLEQQAKLYRWAGLHAGQSHLLQQLLPAVSGAEPPCLACRSCTSALIIDDWSAATCTGHVVFGEGSSDIAVVLAGSMPLQAQR